MTPMKPHLINLKLTQDVVACSITMIRYTSGLSQLVINHPRLLRIISRYY